jgi:nicotinamide mononucleotide adenylyltransferase
MFDWQKPTAQMLGRYQPWHDGHQALFERLLSKYGQVCIMIRDMPTNEKNPFTAEHVKGLIHNRLSKDFDGQYIVIVVPNIVHIGWGRDVGYTAGQEVFDDSIHDISATKIRKEMGLG